MKQLNMLLDVAVVEQNKEKTDTSSTNKKTSIWNKISLKKAKAEVAPMQVQEETPQVHPVKAKSVKIKTHAKSSSKTDDIILEEQHLDPADIKFDPAEEKKPAKSSWKKIMKQRPSKSGGQGDSSDAAVLDNVDSQISGGDSTSQIGQQSDSVIVPKTNKSGLMKSLLKKLPRGTAFGFLHHMLTEEGVDGLKIITVKNYDTEKPDFINFYNQFKPNEKQSRISYVKKNMSFHYIVNYKQNFLKLVTNMTMEHSYVINVFNECLLPAIVSSDFYKLICFKNKLSSLNLILELSQQVPNIEFIFDAELVAPDVNLRVKLFEPYLVKQSVKKENCAFVYNFFVKKPELKSLLASKYLEIVLYSHFNHTVIKFSAQVFVDGQKDFLAYRSTLACNAIELTNASMDTLPVENIGDSSVESQSNATSDNITTDKSDMASANDLSEPMEESLDDMIEMWSTDL